MKKYGVFAVAVLTLLGMLAPPVFAAEAPKVTINGFFDLATEWSDNKQDQITTNEEDQWYSRVRAYFLIQGQVGKAKAVWRNELDFANGGMVSAQGGTTDGFDLDTDVRGIETKWLYLEFPFTGPGSLLPFIEQPTTARGGAQPFGHDDKVGILASGDYGGFSLRTAITPQVKNHFSFAQADEGLTGLGDNVANQDNWAIVDTVEFTPQKGLTVRPTFSYYEMQGAGSASLGNPNRGGFDQGTNNLTRVTIGADILWRQGPYTLDPTFHYQFGEQQTVAVPDTEVDINAWIFDVIGGWREGPLNIQGRFVYTSGNEANECVTSSECSPGGEDINYYNAINAAFSYFGGWTEIWTGGLEYNNAFLGGTPGLGRRQSIGYDKYGLITVAVKGSYAVTPAFSVVALVSPSWTAEDVDTNGSFDSDTGITPSSAATGDDNFLGTEINFGFDWKFAPNLTFGWRYAHLFAGDALDQCPSGTTCSTPAEAEDIDLTAARVRFTF